MRKVAYVLTSVKNSGPVQVLYNLISHLDRSQFEPVLITLYNEIHDSLDRFLELDLGYYHCPLSKKDILLNNTASLKHLLEDINPDVVHSLGVFPDYAISRLGYNAHVITLHNFMNEDYIQKFGFLKGTLLKSLQLSAVKRARRVWVCSKSLRDMYRDWKDYDFDYIQNGVDTNLFCPVDTNVNQLKTTLHIGKKDIVCVYAAQFIERKNQKFLLEQFSNRKDTSIKLLLLGEGVDYLDFKNQYSTFDNIIFAGKVSNPIDYYRIANIYVSSSRSEGLPTSVMEAMACGLPILVSDIPQHREFFETNQTIGDLFALDDESDFETKLAILLNSDLAHRGNTARELVGNHFSAKRMSEDYQKGYLEIINENQTN